MLVLLVLLACRWRRWSSVLGRLEGEVVALRADVTGYRAAHENMTVTLDRRLLELERTTAGAAIELRMASEQMLGRLVTDSSTGDERDRS